MISNVNPVLEKKLASKIVTESLSPLETMTIAELAQMVKKTGLYNKFSDKEFDSLILSRRPLELLFMANACL